ncbi:MAG TPA: hypothetical protein VET69_02790 [Terriglobales bacterium]|jgi:hypothetical protein|nr:hypothetical protein [Terriglobales bacterium]
MSISKVPVSGKFTTFAFLALASVCAGGAVASQSATPQPSAVKRHTHSKKQAQPAQEPALPPGPLQPLNLDQIPAVPPQVTFQAGQLSISAQNSTLGDILRAVRKQTGATMDIPPNATERVVGKIGPGPARDVLATLLNGSHFNYVLLGSEQDPGAVAQVILSPKSGGGAGSGSAPVNQGFGGMAAGYQQPGANGGVQVSPQAAAAMNTDENNDSAMEVGTPSADPSEQADQGDNPQEGAPEGVQQGQPGVKTPEQLLQELQRQQLLQQQLQQQQQQQQPQPGQQPQQQPLVQPPNRPELQDRPN